MSLKTLLTAGLLLLMAWMIGNFLSRDTPTPVPAGRPMAETIPLPTPRLAVYTDRECLARNLAFETAPNSHSREGIGALMAREEVEAIARTVFQRVALGKRVGYRDTICDVVYQEGAFSWTYKLPRNAVPTEPARWRYMIAAADDLLAGKFQHHWPEANRCIENYKRTDNKRVGKKPAKWFKENTAEVAVYGDHTFFCPKKVLTTARK